MQRDETIPFHNETCSDEERALLQAKFWKLLSRQTALFTMGESRSVPHETAQEFCVPCVIHLKSTVSMTWNA